jgi:hypothetical protein
MNSIPIIQLLGRLIPLLEEYLLIDGDLLSEAECNSIEEEIDEMSRRRNWLVNRELFKDIEKERIG